MELIDEDKKLEFQTRLIEWQYNNGRTFDWRCSTDPFHLLVAEVLLKRTGAWKAEEAYTKIIKKYSTPYLMSYSADEQYLKEIIKPLGLTNRAESLIHIAKEIIERFNGSVPENYDDLISIKDIGKYTANAILCFSFNKKVPIVDESVKRLYLRVFNYSSAKAAYADKKLWSFALYMLPDRNYKLFNYALLDFAALICKSANPLCDECILVKLCVCGD